METPPDGERAGVFAVSASDGARETGPALESHYRFTLWLVPVPDRFPRSQTFLLGDTGRSVGA